MTKIEQAEADYQSGLKYKEIAEKYGVSLNTVKSWKTRYGWQKVCTQNKKGVHTKKQDKRCNARAPTNIIENEALTEKQRLFCMFYLRSFNATQAYLKAYGGSYNVANVEGYRNLVKPSIKAEITRLKAIKKESLFIDEDDIVERYMRIAFADITDFTEFGVELVPEYDPATEDQKIDEEGNPVYWKRNYLYFKNHDQVDGGLISEIKTGKQGISLKLEDKQKALDWLSDFFGMNPAHKHKAKYDMAKLEVERQKLEVMRESHKKPQPPADPLILQPVYGRGDNDAT